MSTHIIQFDKYRFVCGLFWQSLSRPRELRQEASELAKKINLDLMVLRKEHGSAQAGFAHTADGARSGMYSLAAALAQTLARRGVLKDGRHQPVHNWLGAFKLPGGMWTYFAVRDENFLPNGDFSGTKEEVLERLHGDYGLGGWNAVIGDKELEEFGFHNFHQEDIETLLPRKKNGRIKVQDWWELKCVDRKISRNVVIAAAVAAVIAVIGAGTYWMHYQRQKEEQERARLIEQARKKIQGTASEVPHPWPQKPLPLALTQACIDKLALIAPAGWALGEYVCDASQIRYAWSRGNSAVGYLLEEVPGAAVELTGEKASYWEQVKLAVGQDEKLVESKQLLMPLISKFQQLGLSLKIASMPPPPPPPGTDKNKVPQPDWQVFTASVAAGGVPPIEIAAILTEPGVRLDKLSYRGGEWLIEGVIYAK